MKKLILCLSILSMFSLYAENIKVIENKTISSIDISDTLHIGYGSKISKVIMDTENSMIKSIILEGTAFIQDYSFISKCKNLETLVMNDIKIDNLSFLEKCKNLKILSFDSVSFIKFPEINQMENLEYLGITNCNLKDFSILTNHKDKLKYINLNNNKILKLPRLRSNDKALYFVYGNNQISSKGKRIIATKNFMDKLPDEYKLYIR